MLQSPMHSSFEVLLLLWLLLVVLASMDRTAAFVVVPTPSHGASTVPLWKCCRHDAHHQNRDHDADDSTPSTSTSSSSLPVLPILPDATRRCLVVAAATAVGWNPPFTPAVRASTTTFLVSSSSSSSSPKKDLPEDYRQGTAALGRRGGDADNNDMAPVPREAYVQLPSGVIYADVVKPSSSSSSNNIAQVGSKVNIQWVLRRSNGYFVDSSQIHDSVPFVFTVGETTTNGGAIAGLDEGIRGMPVGGVRRLLIPPSLAYVRGVEDGLPGPIPVGYGPRQQIRRIQNIRQDVPGEYIYLEIQLTRLR